MNAVPYYIFRIGSFGDAVSSQSMGGQGFHIRYQKHTMLLL
jgi:hypothetical protein